MRRIVECLCIVCLAVVTVSALIVIAIVGTGGGAAFPVLAVGGTAGAAVSTGTVASVATGVAVTGAATMSVAAIGSIHECSGKQQKNGKDYVKAKNNKTANKWAEEVGYEGAEDLKKAL